MPIAEKNRKNVNAMDAYAEVARYILHIGGLVGFFFSEVAADFGIVPAPVLTSLMKVMIYESLRIWLKLAIS